MVGLFVGLLLNMNSAHNFVISYITQKNVDEKLDFASKLQRQC
jgi:hypothetical protein